MALMHLRNLSFNAPVDNDESIVARESELHFEGAIPKALPAEEEVTPVDTRQP